MPGSGCLPGSGKLQDWTRLCAQARALPQRRLGQAPYPLHLQLGSLIQGAPGLYDPARHVGVLARMHPGGGIWPAQWSPHAQHPRRTSITATTPGLAASDASWSAFSSRPGKGKRGGVIMQVHVHSMGAACTRGAAPLAGCSSFANVLRWLPCCNPFPPASAVRHAAWPAPSNATPASRPPKLPTSPLRSPPATHRTLPWPGCPQCRAAPSSCCAAASGSASAPASARRSRRRRRARLRGGGGGGRGGPRGGVGGRAASAPSTLALRSGLR